MGRMQVCLGEGRGHERSEGREACAKGAILCIAVFLSKHVREFRGVNEYKPRSKTYNFGAR